MDVAIIRTVLWGLVALASVPVLACSSARQAVRYAPTEVTLVGSIRVDEHFGPPNFGEGSTRDVKYQVPVLVLSEPIDVLGDAQDEVNRRSVTGVTEIQLVGGAAGQQERISCRGRIVAATGTLETGLLPGNFTSVVMHLKKMTAPDGLRLDCR